VKKGSKYGKSFPNPEIYFKIRGNKKVVDTRFSRIYDILWVAGGRRNRKGLWHFHILLYLAEIFVNTCVFNKLKQADFPAFCCFFAGIMDK